MPATSSVIRHLLTYLAGLGGLLFSWHIIAAGDVAAVDSAAKEMITPLSVILGAVAAGLGRMVIAWISNLFRVGSGDAGNDVGAGMLLVWVGTTAGLFCCLPSCSPDAVAAMRAVPIKACYLGDHGERICYSTQEGVLVEVDRSSAK